MAQSCGTDRRQEMNQPLDPQYDREQRHNDAQITRMKNHPPKPHDDFDLFCAAQKRRVQHMLRGTVNRVNHRYEDPDPPRSELTIEQRK